jgi:HAE1 family hydrophobic/amphiphilic exporter-1
MGLIEATVEGAKLRFRPILMTSLAFGFGVLPLAITTGAGAGAQNAIGTSVLGGMVTATVLVVIFVPLFYVLIERIFGRQHRQASGKADQNGISHEWFKELFSKRLRRKPPATRRANPPEVK